MKQKLRGRWHPSPQQISLAIDCAVARMPLEKAAKLLHVKPRTVWPFGRRFGMPFPAPAGRSRAAENAAQEGGLLMASARVRRSIHGASVAPWAMSKPWRARIFVNGRHLSLGYYATQEGARAAHAAAAEKHGLKLKPDIRCVALRCGATIDNCKAYLIFCPPSARAALASSLLRKYPK
jgi:hypothetical protein